jgi:hypothetical protein
MKTCKFCMHLDLNTLNICQKKKSFRAKVVEKNEIHYFCHFFPESLTVSETVKLKLRYAYFCTSRVNNGLLNKREDCRTINNSFRKQEKITEISYC